MSLNHKPPARGPLSGGFQPDRDELSPSTSTSPTLPAVPPRPTTPSDWRAGTPTRQLIGEISQTIHREEVERLFSKVGPRASLSGPSQSSNSRLQPLPPPPVPTEHEAHTGPANPRQLPPLRGSHGHSHSHSHSHNGSEDTDHSSTSTVPGGSVGGFQSSFTASDGRIRAPDMPGGDMDEPPSPNFSDSNGPPLFPKADSLDQNEEMSAVLASVRESVARTRAQFGSFSASGEELSVHNVHNGPAEDETVEAPKLGPPPPTQSVTQDSGGGDDDKSCVICLDLPRDTVVVPCGHFCLCNSCAVVLFKKPKPICPYCRQAAQRPMRVFQV